MLCLRKKTSTLTRTVYNLLPNEREVVYMNMDSDVNECFLPGQDSRGILWYQLDIRTIKSMYSRRARHMERYC